MGVQDWERELELALIALRKDAMLAAFANATALWRNFQVASFAALTFGTLGFVQRLLVLEAFVMVLLIGSGGVALSVRRLKFHANLLDEERRHLAQLIERLKHEGGR